MSNELLKDALDPRLNSGSDTRRGLLQRHREHCEGSMGVSTTPEDNAHFEYSTRVFLRDRYRSFEDADEDERLSKLLAEYRLLKNVQNADKQKHGDEVDIILSQRQEQWGDAYKQIAGDWNSVLGMEVTNAEFIAMMILMKLRRWSNSDFEADDCLTDIIGYAKLGLSLSTDA